VLKAVTPSPAALSSHWVRITNTGVQQARMPFSEAIQYFWSGFRRIATITKAEMKATYFGKSLGWLWLLIEPLLVAFMYWFITAVLFNLNPAETDHFLKILTLVIFWLWWSRTICIAPSMFMAYSAMLRDTNFSVFMALGITVLKDVVTWLFSFVVLLAFIMLYRHSFPVGVAILALPVVWVAQLMLMIAISMFLAIAGTFIKDLGGFLAQFLCIMWYMSPCFYSLELATSKMGRFVWIYKINPFYWLFPPYESIIIDNKFPPLGGVFVLMLLCIPPLMLGFWLFKKARYYYFYFL